MATKSGLRRASFSCIFALAVVAITVSSLATPLAADEPVDEPSSSSLPHSKNLSKPDSRNTISSRNLDNIRYYDTYIEVKTYLELRLDKLIENVFISYDTSGNTFQSTQYTFNDFVRVLRSMSVGGVGAGDTEQYFYTGQTDGMGVIHGLVNIAAFLSQAMAVSIKFDICDEFHMDDTTTNNQYAISNSCGQWGRDYGTEMCTGDEESLTCGVGLNNTIVAASTYGSFPPFQCKPKETASDYTGFWHGEGYLVEAPPFANRAGRIDTEGCCWWGRGVLQTRSACMFGKLNAYLGAGAAKSGYANYYDFDFCAYPEIVCEGPSTRDVRWAVGYYEWLDRVQTFVDRSTGMTYLEHLDAYIERGFEYEEEFINVVGMAIPIGCSDLGCYSAGKISVVDEERKANFLMLVHDILDIPGFAKATPLPTPSPTANATGSSDDSFSSVLWYPKYTTWETGVCINTSPVPGNIETFASQLECCVTFFSTQVDGHCLGQVPAPAPVDDSIGSVEPLPTTPQPTYFFIAPPPSSSPVEAFIFLPTPIPTFTETELVTLPSDASSRSRFRCTFIAIAGCLIAFVA
mmetsp:Transcript_21940/g.47541  ORF Transcript_21940/g.47541 Transcript_21940/m.47541 type:complete len:575 (-) Transcript_21940:109-1833(-)